MFHSPRLYIEIGQSSLKALDGPLGYEWPLEREDNGRLTAACKEQLAAQLKAAFGKRNFLWQSRAICAIGIRGVSLRRLNLPRAPREELDRVLALQIESEFPLNPSALCWGYYCVGKPSSNSSQQAVVVAALKKSGLQDYAELIAGAGLKPVFTLGAWARCFLCQPAPASFAILDIGRTSSEFIWFEEGAPAGLRTLPWGGASITRAIQLKLEVTPDEADRIKIHLTEQVVSDRELGQKIESAIRSEVASLAELLKRQGAFQKLYLSGKTARLKDLAPALKAAWRGLDCQSLETLPRTGRSAAILGAKYSCEKNGGVPALAIEPKELKAAETSAQRAQARQVVPAALILAALFALRYAPPILNKSRVASRLTVVRPYKDTFQKLDAELDFLQFIKDNQPPYLDALYLLAKAAPPGSRIDSLSMNRQGELSLRSSMRDPQQIVEFRSKLIESRFFSSVVVDEQAPAPDRQKTTFRMTAQWKPGSAREAVPVDSAKPAEKVRSAPERVKAPPPATNSLISAPGSNPPPKLSPKLN